MTGVNEYAFFFRFLRSIATIPHNRPVDAAAIRVSYHARPYCTGAGTASF